MIRRFKFESYNIMFFLFNQLDHSKYRIDIYILSSHSTRKPHMIALSVPNVQHTIMECQGDRISKHETWKIKSIV